jgi:hypothetical protein
MSELSNNHADGRPAKWLLPTFESGQDGCFLLLLPRELLECILQKLDAVSLACCSLVCRLFTQVDKGTLNIIDKICRKRVQQIIGDKLAGRFR